MTAKTPKITRESDAWFLLAAMFDRHQNRNYRVNSFETGIAASYLCGWTNSSYATRRRSPEQRFRNQVDAELLERMTELLKSCVPDGQMTLYSHDSEYDNDRRVQHGRVMGCLMFGWQSQDRERAASRLSAPREQKND